MNGALQPSSPLRKLNQFLLWIVVVSPFFHRSVASALLIGPVVLLASGCVTILSGSSENIRTESDPDGASVFVDGLRRGSETPTTVILKHSYSDV